MKRLIKIFLFVAVIAGHCAFGQETKSQLVTRFDVIRNETSVGGNTKTRIANAYQELSDGSIGVFPVTASGTDTYTGSLVGLDAYTGRIVFITFPNNNTGASTLNLNSIGAITIRKDVSGTWTALDADDILANKLYRLYNDGTRWQIDLGGAGGSGGWTLNGTTNLTGPVSITSTNPLSFVTTDDIVVQTSDSLSLNFNTLLLSGLQNDDTKDSVLVMSGDGVLYWRDAATLGGGGGLTPPVDATDIADGSVTDTEFQYLDGVTSDIQTQLDGKQDEFTSQTAATVYAAPGSSSGVPAFLSLTPEHLATLNASRTVTSGSASVQSDNLHKVYLNSAGSNNMVIDLLAVGTEITFINIGAGTWTLTQGSGVTLPGGSVTVESGANAVVIYRVAATPDVYTGVSGALTEDDLTDSRTMTSADDLDQTDNLNIVYADSGTPFNITVDLLAAKTQVTVINKNTATVTLIEGSGVTLVGTTIDIEEGESALIIYEDPANPDVYLSTTGGGGSGTVTSTSVVTANGFAGSVATSTTTPDITLSTTVTGLLKGNGTAISAATSGTDYAPATSGSSVLKANGSGGFSNATNADLPAMTATVGGAVPTPPNNTTTFLRGDGTFATPTGSGDVTGPSSSVDSEVALFNSTTGKIIKRASATGWAKLTSGVLSAITPGTNVETFVTTPTYTNFLAAVTGTSPYYLTASGGAATASNTRTFNTNGWDNTTYTYTTTGNGQYASNATGTITHRATVSDFTYGHTTSRTFVTSANTQRSVDLWLKPVFTNGAFANPENFSLLAETGTVVIGTPSGSAIPITQKFKIFGGSTSSTDIGLEVVDSGNVPLLKVFNNGTVNVKSNGILEWQNANARIRSEATGSLSLALDANHPASGGFRFRAHAASQTATNDYPIVTVEGTFSPTSGAARWIGIKQLFSINQTGTASGDIVGYHYAPVIGALLGKNIAFLSESGQHLFNGTTVTASTTVDVRGVSSGTIARFADNSNTEKFKFLNTGSLVLEATNTAGGTTGDRTINKISGTVNIAAAGTTVTVTNSLVTTSSIVFAVVRTNDTTAVIKNVVPGSGSFVINMNAAVTAETSIGFFVIN